MRYVDEVVMFYICFSKVSFINFRLAINFLYGY
jgi:hypothetical protein